MRAREQKKERERERVRQQESSEQLERMKEVWEREREREVRSHVRGFFWTRWCDQQLVGKYLHASTDAYTLHLQIILNVWENSKK